MICCLCGDEHHAMQCRLARSTLIAAKTRPEPPPTPVAREDYRTECLPPRGDMVSFYDVVVAVGQRMWADRRRPHGEVEQVELDEAI